MNKKLIIRKNLMVTKNRFFAMPFLVRFFLAATIFIIFVIEFFISNLMIELYMVQALIKVSLNLSYSYFAGFVLYYFVVFLPLERKKVAAFRTISNSLSRINAISRYIIYSIYRSSAESKNIKFDEIDVDNFREICRSVDAEERCIVEAQYFQNIEFVNWYEALEFNSKLINKNIESIMNFSDCLEPNLLRVLLGIEDDLNTVVSLINPNNARLKITLYSCADEILWVYKDALYAMNMFNANYSKLYASEYHFEMRNFNVMTGRVHDPVI